MSFRLTARAEDDLDEIDDYVDSEGALANRQNHGLRFAEAAELFESGVEHLEIFDVDHSESEDRFIAIGPIARGLTCRPLHRT